MDRTRWKAQLTDEERSWVWGVIGKRSAQKLETQALAYFANGEDRFMHDDHLAWKARAGMRAGAWAPCARRHRRHERRAAAAQPDWVYWKARALQALKLPDAATATAQARTLLESIASERGFYEQLALEDLGRPITTPPAPGAADRRGNHGRAAQPGPAPRAHRHAAGPAQRRRARVELHRRPARRRRHGRARTAGRRGTGLRGRAVGPLHQHQPAHARPRKTTPSASPRPTARPW